MADIFEMMKGCLRGQRWTLPSWMRQCQYGNWHGMYVEEYEPGVGVPRLILRHYPSEAYKSGYVPRSYEIESDKWAEVGDGNFNVNCPCREDDDV